MQRLIWTLFLIGIMVAGWGAFAGSAYAVNQSCADGSAPVNGFCATLGQDPVTGNHPGQVTTSLADPNKAFALIGPLISVIITVVLFAGALTCLVLLALGAIQWGAAQGGDGAAKGRTTMKYAVAGLVILGCVYLIMLYFNRILPAATG